MSTIQKNAMMLTVQLIVCIPPALSGGRNSSVSQGTPVNQETLAKWKADRKAKKLAEERRKVSETSPRVLAASALSYQKNCL